MNGASHRRPAKRYHCVMVRQGAIVAVALVILILVAAECAKVLRLGKIGSMEFSVS